MLTWLMACAVGGLVLGALVAWALLPPPRPHRPGDERHPLDSEPQ